MKIFFILVFLLISLPVFAVENLYGRFSLDNQNYEFHLTYTLTNNQEAAIKSVNYFGSSTIPETGFEAPAYCAYSVALNVPYKIIIKDMTNGKEIYSNNGLTAFNVNAGGGLLSEGKCNWNINGWEVNTQAQLRINVHSLLINNQYYRFVLDTQALVWLKGSDDATIYLKSFIPHKGSDGKKDGEVWLDTMPDQNGKYTRTWFQLKI